MNGVWLPNRPSEPVVDNWPPKPLPIYADIDYERMPRMTEQRTPPPDDPEVDPDVRNDPVPEAPQPGSGEDDASTQEDDGA